MQVPIDPRAHFFPSTHIAPDKFDSSKIAPEIFAPSKLASKRFAPLNEEVNRFAPSKLTFAKLELSKFALLQFVYCILAENKLELLKLVKIKFPNAKLELFSWDFSILANDKFTPDISDLAKPTPDKSRFSTKLQLVQLLEPGRVDLIVKRIFFTKHN